MKSILLLTTMSFLFFLTKAQSSQDKEAVKNVVIAFQKDFNDGFKGAALYTTMDWEHIPPGGGLFKGRDSILKGARDVHQSYLKGVTMKIESIDINFPVPDVAVADVVHKISTYTTPDGVKHENERRLKTYIIVKQKGKWLLFQDHATVIQG
jgi:uncharacterized protein (TIGR02246 family)